MFNQYSTNIYWYLHDYSLFNCSFSNAILVLIDSLDQINIYQYLSFLPIFSLCLKEHLTGPDQYFNDSHSLVILRQTLLE